MGVLHRVGNDTRMMRTSACLYTNLTESLEVQVTYAIGATS